MRKKLDSDKSNERPVLPTDHQQGTDTPPEPSSITLIDSTETPIPDASPALPTIHPKPTPITKKENQPKSSQVCKSYCYDQCTKGQQCAFAHPPKCINYC